MLSENAGQSICGPAICQRCALPTTVHLRAANTASRRSFTSIGMRRELRIGPPVSGVMGSPAVAGTRRLLVDVVERGDGEPSDANAD
jgi:hypothetical protein